VAYRYDLRSDTGERLPNDPRRVFDATYDPATTGLTLPKG
jgi:hypothetical protein